MGAANVLHSRHFPSGGLYFEIARIQTTSATSVDVELGFTSRLRVIEGIEMGRLCTPSLALTTGVTWSNAAVGSLNNGIRYPAHALVTVSGISSTAGEKTFDLVMWGKV